jgi:hypothetical protein
MTSKAEALQKLRVTLLICTEGLPQWAQRWSEDISRDDDEFAGEADFDDGLGGLFIFKLLGGMSGNDVIQRADQVPKLADCRVWHGQSL